MLDTVGREFLAVLRRSWFVCLAPGLVNAQNAKPNVLVLVLDQLRADELHCYGNPRLTSPNIDKLASPRSAVVSLLHRSAVDIALLRNPAYFAIPLQARGDFVLEARHAAIE